MRKNYSGKLLSIALASALTFTSVVPSYAGETDFLFDEEETYVTAQEEQEAAEEASEVSDFIEEELTDAKTFKIYYGSNLDTAETKVDFSEYPATYTYSDSEPVILEPAPHRDFYDVSWYLGEVKNETVTKAYPEVYIGNNLDVSDNAYYTVPEGFEGEALGFFAEYTKREYSFSFGGTPMGDNVYYVQEENYYYTLSKDQAFSFDEKDSVTLLPCTRESHEFAGWYFREDGMNRYEDVPSEKQGDTTVWKYTCEDDSATHVMFYPIWEGATFEVKLLDGASKNTKFPVNNMPSVKEVQMGRMLTLPAPSREGYDFSGWYVFNYDEYGGQHFEPFGRDDYDGEEVWSYIFNDYHNDLARLTIEGDKKYFIITAGWNPKLYPVEYELDKGEFYTETTTYSLKDAEDSEQNYYFFWEAYRSGYDFEGWFSDANFSEGSALKQVTEEDLSETGKFYGPDYSGVCIGQYYFQPKTTDVNGLTFYAKFKKREKSIFAKIIYDLDGGKNNERNPEEACIDYLVNIEDMSDGFFMNLYAPEKEGYDFMGWYYDAARKNPLDISFDYESGVGVWFCSLYDIADFDKQEVEGNTTYSLTFYADWSVAEEPTPETYYVDYDYDSTEEAYEYSEEDGFDRFYYWIHEFYPEPGYKLTKENLPTLYRLGYAFLGWKRDLADDEYVKVGDVVTGSMTLYADWKPADYEITFHANYGEKDITNTKKYTLYDEGYLSFRDVFNVKQVPNSQASKFVFWDSATTDMDLSKESDEFDPKNPSIYEIIKRYNNVQILTRYGEDATEKIDLYANYGATNEEFTVKFNAYPDKDFDPSYVALDFEDSEYNVGSVSDLIQYKTIKVGQDLTLSGKEFDRHGYVLKGWKCGETTYPSSGTISFANAKDKDLIELTAIWEKAPGSTYTVEFVTNGGKPKLKNTTYSYENPLTLPGKGQVTKDGYKFTGWYERADLQGSAVTPAILGRGGGIISGNVKLYAGWEPTRVAITFDTNGGSRLDPVNLYYGEKLSLKNYQTTRDGYKFDKWVTTYTNEKGKTIDKKFSYSGSLSKLTNVDADITLKATWKPINYKIKYVKPTGVNITSAPAKYAPETNKSVQGAADIVIPIPSKVGYEFVRWVVTPYSKKDATWIGIKASMGEDGVFYLNKEKKNEKDQVIGYSLTAGDNGNFTLTPEFVPIEYTIRFMSADGTKQVAANMDFVSYTNDAVDLTMAMLEGSDDKTSISGFAKEKNAAKAYFVPNKTYKMSSIVSGAEITDKVITLYAVQEQNVKHFVITKAVAGDQTIDLTYSYAPADGFIVPNPDVYGYTFDKWTVSGGTEGTDYTVDKDTGTLTIVKNSAVNKLELSTTLTPVSYKVLLMPTAKDVKVGGQQVTTEQNKYGVVYTGAVLSYGNDIVLDAASLPEWTKEGYHIAGYGLKKVKAEKAEKTMALGSLNLSDIITAKGGEKERAVRVYVIWEANGVTASFAKYAKVSGSNNAYTVNDVRNSYSAAKKIIRTNNEGEITYTISSEFGKNIALPTLKMEGYKFLGYAFADPDEYGGNEPDVKTDKKGYIKSITKNNSVQMVNLVPVFSENEYRVKVNPNGGTYKGNSGSTDISNVKYSDGFAKVADMIYSSDMVRDGYHVSGIALSKSPNTESKVIRNPYSYRILKNITVYVQWAENTTAKQMIFTASYADGKLNVKGVNLEADTLYIVEYSKDKNFAYGVKRAPENRTYVRPGSSSFVVENVEVPAADAYYVRICTARYEDGEEVLGDWTVITAAAPAGKNVVKTLTVKYVLVNGEGTAEKPYVYDDVTAGSVTVTAAVGETISKLIIPEIKNYTGDGIWYKTKEVNAEGAEVDENLKVTEDATFYTKVDFEDVDFKLNFICDVSGNCGSVDDISGNTLTVKDIYGRDKRVDDVSGNNNGHKNGIDIKTGTTTWKDVLNKLTPPEGMERAIGEFLGWFTIEKEPKKVVDASGKLTDVVNENDVISNTAGNVYLQSRFDISKAYDIIFNISNKEEVTDKDAVNRMDPVTIKYGTTWTIADIIPVSKLTVPKDMKFDRWEVSVDGKVVYRLPYRDRYTDLSRITNEKGKQVDIKATYKSLQDCKVYVYYMYDDVTEFAFEAVAKENRQLDNVVKETEEAKSPKIRYGYTRKNPNVYQKISYDDWGYYRIVSYSEIGRLDGEKVFLEVSPVEYTVTLSKNDGSEKPATSDPVWAEYVHGAYEYGYYDEGYEIYAPDADNLSDFGIWGEGWKIDGYEFSSWNTKPDGSGTTIKAGELLNGLAAEYEPDGTRKDVVLYAQWKPISFTVRFLPNKGTGNAKNLTVTYGDGSKAPKNDFTKQGSTFVGWAFDTYVSADDVEYYYPDEFSLSSLFDSDKNIYDGKIIKLYAVWKPNLQLQ